MRAYIKEKGGLSSTKAKALHERLWGEARRLLTVRQKHVVTGEDTDTNLTGRAGGEPGRLHRIQYQFASHDASTGGEGLAEISVITPEPDQRVVDVEGLPRDETKRLDELARRWVRSGYPGTLHTLFENNISRPLRHGTSFRKPVRQVLKAVGQELEENRGEGPYYRSSDG